MTKETMVLERHTLALRRARSGSRLLAGAAAVAVVLAMAPQLAAQGVRIVGPTGTSNFTSIQAAVDAAVNGDVILIAPGTYTGFTIAYKSLTLAAATGPVFVNGSVQVLGLPLGNQAALIGLHAIGGTGGHGLWVANCAGHVLVQDSSFLGHYGGQSGIEVSSSFSVALVGCSGTGSDGYYVGDGGDGLRSSNSSVAAYDCAFEGGPAESIPEAAGNGGWGYRGDPGSLLLASGTIATGGAGGSSWTCSLSGTGGAGFGVAPGAELYLLDAEAIAGPGGADPCGGHGGVLPGVFNQGGTLLNYPAAARTLNPRPAVISDNTDWPLSIWGQSGDRIYLPSSRIQGGTFAPNLFGVWLIDLPAKSGALLGVVPASGNLIALRSGPDVPAGLTHRTIISQVAAVDVAGKRILGPATMRIVLNREAGPDCNGNGVQDYVEIIEGLVPDVNHNLIPDTCPGG